MTQEPRRRRHRRAYGGTVPGTRSAPAAPDARDAAGAGGVGGEPVVAAAPGTGDGRGPGRAPDDSDVGWGDRPEPDDDERFLREVPPHW